jgi:hypothetical protein
MRFATMAEEMDLTRWAVAALVIAGACGSQGTSLQEAEDKCWRPSKDVPNGCIESGFDACVRCQMECDRCANDLVLRACSSESWSCAGE